MADERDQNFDMDDEELIDEDIAENDQLLFDEDEVRDRELLDPDDLEDVDAMEGFDVGREELVEKLRQHHSQSPELTGGDIDAAWDRADSSGEETVGSTVTTPDQSVVDDLGRAVGLEYQDDEPLNTEEKLSKRDKDRWELNPASEDEPDKRDPQDLDGESV